MKLLHAILALPVQDIARSVAFYRDKLCLTLAHFDEGVFAICRRDGVEICLWAATDESWEGRNGLRPVVSGAESFIAGVASCRIGVDGVDDLYRVIGPLGIAQHRRQPRDPLACQRA